VGAKGKGWRTVRKCKVTFSAGAKGVPVPFGQDRGPLCFMIDRALAERRKSPEENQPSLVVLAVLSGI
jgi:hypothetical protein